MNTKSNVTSKLAGLSLLLGSLCVGANATAAEITSPGHLQVFTATTQSQWGEGSYYFLHTGYRIYDSSGKAVKWVENHDTISDEAPSRADLAPGRYTIVAQSDRGYVKVPVTIKPEQIASLNLEKGDSVKPAAPAAATGKSLCKN